MRSSYTDLEPKPRRRALVGGAALLALAAAAALRRRGATVSAPSLYTVKGAAEEYATDLAACADYDDDAAAGAAGWQCASSDYTAWCAKEHLVGNTSLMVSATTFYEHCAAACAHENHSFAMLCAWETVARLPEVCAGTFDATKPGGSARRNNTFDAARAPRAVDLYRCDEHAFCASCSAGNAYCDAVASYYGGVGVPLRISFKSVINYTDGYISATAAMHALLLDTDFWCADDTLARIEAGTFASRFEPASSEHAGKFGAGKKSWEIGGISWADVQSTADAKAPTERWDDELKVGDDVVQKNWPNLICADDDDDKWDWGAPHSVMHCVSGDSYTCLSYTHEEALWNVCSDTCNVTDENLVSRSEEKAALYGGQWSAYANPHMKSHSWLVPCAWEGIADLPRLCNDTFTPYLPIGAFERTSTASGG